MWVQFKSMIVTFGGSHGIAQHQVTFSFSYITLKQTAIFFLMFFNKIKKIVPGQQSHHSFSSLEHAYVAVYVSVFLDS